MPNESKAYSVGGAAAGPGNQNNVLLFGGISLAADGTTPQNLYPGGAANATLSVPATPGYPMIMPRAGTLQNLYIYNPVPGVSPSILFEVKINGALSGIAATLDPTTSGASDTANSAAVVAGDLVTIEYAHGIGGVDLPALTATMEMV